MEKRVESTLEDFLLQELSGLSLKRRIQTNMARVYPKPQSAKQSMLFFKILKRDFSDDFRNRTHSIGKYKMLVLCIILCAYLNQVNRVLVF